MLPRWLVFLCFVTVSPALGKIVTYYIAAVEDNWSYCPAGRDIIKSNVTFTPQHAETNTLLHNRVYRKALFREFTDETFKIQKFHAKSLGIVGPILRAEVGDRLIVHFFNNASHNHSIHPTDLVYTKSNEGSLYDDGSRGDQRQDNRVIPGQTYTYTWDVPTIMRLNTIACVTSLYYSDVNGLRDMHSGLIGTILICRAGKLNNNTTKHIPLVFGVFNEDLSLYNHDNDEDSNKHYSINGYTFGNLPLPIVCLNDDVIIHAVGIGESHHVHNVKVYGHSMIYLNKRQDSVTVYPGGSVSASLLPTQPGKWLISSLNPQFATRGMQALLSVSDCRENPPKITVNGMIRRYYIAVEEITNRLTRKTYIQFIQYADILHSKRTNDSVSGIHGFLGPMIKAEVGDTVKVVFRNKDKREHSLLPHGVRRHKRNEGVFYSDGEDLRPVPPGGYKTYFWTIPDFFGPTAHGDEACIPSYYTSGVNAPDVDSLIGPMVICKKGMLDTSEGTMRSQENVFLFYTDKDVNGYKGRNIPYIHMSVGDVLHLHMMTYNTKHPMATMDVNNIPFEVNGSRAFSVGLGTGRILSTKIRGIKDGVNELRTTIDKDLVVLINVGNKKSNEVIFGTPENTMYLGIIEKMWDYSEGKVLTKNELEGHDGWIKKAMFQLYRSDYFYFEKDKRSWFYGSIIRTVVGKTYMISIQNSATRWYSLYSPGIHIKQAGSDNTSLAVKPGKVVSFLWNIPESAGPGPADPDCIVRPYYSNVNQEADISSGLIGPLIICRNEEAKSLSENDHVLFVSVTDETKNLYYNQTVDQYTRLSSSVNVTNISYEMNGISNGNIKDFELNGNGNTSLHVLNVGEQFHSLHFHGATITDKGPLEGHNVVPLYPWTTSSFKLMFLQSGKWRYEGLSSDDQQHQMYGSFSLDNKIASSIS